MRSPESPATAPFPSTSTRPDPLRPSSTRTAATAGPSTPVTADSSLSSSTPPTRHTRADASDSAGDGLSVDAVRVVAESPAVPAGDALSIMAQRRSSYPFSSPSDPPGRGQREWQHAGEQNHRDGQTVAVAVAVAPRKTATPSTVPPAAQNPQKLQNSQNLQNPDPHDHAALSSLHPQLSDYRARLARHLELRELSARSLAPTPAPAEKTKVSPVSEEGAASSSPMLTSNTALTNTSTESGQTVRGGMTPAPVAQTPSYPFPRMPSFSHQLPKFVSFPPISPLSRRGTTPLFGHPSGHPPEHRGILDRLLSDSSTPASTFTFEPAATTDYPHSSDFPTPNLYDLSLMLSAEPGLDAWWNTVVQIMRDVYKAERVTLAVPADTTDVENVPWGQRATFNAHQEDKLSLGYMTKGGSSAFQSSEHDAVLDGLAAPHDAAA
ncbi:hypothetical protein E4U42_001318, partial [Claviceps africana]